MAVNYYHYFSHCPVLVSANFWKVWIPTESRPGFKNTLGTIICLKAVRPSIPSVLVNKKTMRCGEWIHLAEARKSIQLHRHFASIITNPIINLQAAKPKCETILQCADREAASGRRWNLKRQTDKRFKDDRLLLAFLTDHRRLVLALQCHANYHTQRSQIFFRIFKDLESPGKWVWNLLVVQINQHV